MAAVLLLTLITFGMGQDVPTEADVVKEIQAGHLVEAEALATKRIAANPKSARDYLLRGTIREQVDKLADTVDDFTKALAYGIEDKDKPRAFDHRGSAHFMLGHIKESIADFDAYLKLQPKMTSQHWRRGIAYYYDGRFDDGRKQFEAYESVDGNDVENVVWRAMCVARKDGFEKSQATMAPVGFDRRVPMMTIYKLFKGEATPEDVMKAADKDAPNDDEAKQRTFYAHLYIGLYSEIKGDKAATKEHLKRAVAVYPHGPYMWAVARTHLKLMEKREK
jgi:lipoprotein NlpI